MHLLNAEARSSDENKTADFPEFARYQFLTIEGWVNLVFPFMALAAQVFLGVKGLYFGPIIWAFAMALYGAFMSWSMGQDHISKRAFIAMKRVVHGSLLITVLWAGGLGLALAFHWLQDTQNWLGDGFYESSWNLTKAAIAAEVAIIVGAAFAWFILFIPLDCTKNGWYVAQRK